MRFCHFMPSMPAAITYIYFVLSVVKHIQSLGTVPVDLNAAANLIRVAEAAPLGADRFPVASATLNGFPSIQMRP
jgi:hypothetical protein